MARFPLLTPDSCYNTQSSTGSTGSQAVIRDYTIAHPEVAQKYSELKRELAKKYPEDIQSYMNGKNGFIKEVEKKALEWQNLN